MAYATYHVQIINSVRIVYSNTYKNKGMSSNTIYSHKEEVAHQSMIYIFTLLSPTLRMVTTFENL